MRTGAVLLHTDTEIQATAGKLISEFIEYNRINGDF